MKKLVAVGLLCLASYQPVLASPLRTSNLSRLTRLYHDLTLDQRLDRAKLDRLVAVALEDDLVLDPREQALIQGFIARGYDDPSGDGPPEVTATFNGERPKGWVARAQKLLVMALHASLLSRRGIQALRELEAIAWRSDLTADDRDRILELIDNYRVVDTQQRSRDMMEALTVLLTNPEQARLDEDHRRQLELLARVTNSPAMVWGPGQATGSKTP